MSKLNDDFLEAFKRLDKICREMYMNEKGVTSYINDMENTPQYESLYIANWNTDLRQLKRLRHLRNQLTHEVGTLNTDMCTQSDIDWLKSFCWRIFNRTDPLALLYIGKKKAQLLNIAPAAQQSAYTYIEPEAPKQSSKTLRIFMAFSLCMTAIIMIAVIVYKLFLR